MAIFVIKGVVEVQQMITQLLGMAGDIDRDSIGALFPEETMNTGIEIAVEEQLQFPPVEFGSRRELHNVGPEYVVVSQGCAIRIWRGLVGLKGCLSEGEAGHSRKLPQGFQQWN